MQSRVPRVHEAWGLCRSWQWLPRSVAEAAWRWLKWRLSWRQPVNQSWPLSMAGTSAFAPAIASPFLFTLCTSSESKREKTPPRSRQVCQALLSVREVKGWSSHSKGWDWNQGQGIAKPLVKLSWRHMATQQPRSLWAPWDLYHTGHEGWSWATRHRGVQAKPPFHAPTHAIGALTGLKACGFCFGFKEGEQMPKKQC